TVYTDADSLRLSALHSAKQRTWNWIGFTPVGFLVVASITRCSAATTVPHAGQTSPAARLPDTFDTLSYGSRPLRSNVRMRRRTLFSSMSNLPRRYVRADRYAKPEANRSP